MDDLKSNKLGKLRNIKCPYCESGRKFKKCGCYIGLQELFTMQQKMKEEVIAKIEAAVKKQKEEGPEFETV